jgi:hypothetical protein
MKNAPFPRLRKRLEKEAMKAIKDELNELAEKLNKASLELFPTTIASYYLKYGGSIIINEFLTEEQHKAVRKLVGM